jgi:hypothetical protein
VAQECIAVVIVRMNIRQDGVPKSVMAVISAGDGKPTSSSCLEV